MIFTETKLKGVYVIDIEIKQDVRGFFGRVFCQEEFKQLQLNPVIDQVSISYNKKKATLRGMHIRTKGYEETKIVRCLQGAIYDVIIDIRPGSATYGQWLSINLAAGSNQMIYIPKGCAHGFITLEDDTELMYFISEPYIPNTETGYHWKDPAFAIEWPLEPVVISDKDQQYAFLTKTNGNY